MKTIFDYVPLRREVRSMRLRISTLSKNFHALDRLAKEQLEKVRKKGLGAFLEEVKASRLTPDRIRRLRNKLGISQQELGILTGASLGAVAMWEEKKFKPRGEKKAAIVALRKLRKGELEKILAEKEGLKVKAKEKSFQIKERRLKPVPKVKRKKTK